MSSQPYPRTWTEFLEEFSSEDACLAYLEGLRWPNGFICPSCGVASVPYRASRIRMMCKDCGHQSTVTAGTIFDKTRTPLRVWLAAAWYLTNQKQGVSALGLQRVLGLGSSQTAWAMLHRFRRAMVRPDRDRLKGVVEIDETYLAISDREESLSALGRKNNTDKVLVALAVEVLEPRGFGRIRLRRIAEDSQEFVVPFVQASVEPGTQVRTDARPHTDPSATPIKETSCSARRSRHTSPWPACTGSPRSFAASRHHRPRHLRRHHRARARTGRTRLVELSGYPYIHTVSAAEPPVNSLSRVPPPPLVHFHPTRPTVKVDSRVSSISR